jgi:hypothetical protein
MISQYFTRRIIRLYDEAGNVIKTHQHGGSQTAVSYAASSIEPPHCEGMTAHCGQQAVVCSRGYQTSVSLPVRSAPLALWTRIVSGLAT